MKTIILIFLTLLIFTSSNAQKVSEKFCPLKDLFLKENERNFSVIEDYTFGGNVYSHCDSVFAIFDSKVTRIHSNPQTTSLTLRSKNFSIQYNFLKEADLNVGDKVLRGQFVGKLQPDPRENIFMLFMKISEGKTRFTKKQFENFFKDCLHDN